MNSIKNRVQAVSCVQLCQRVGLGFRIQGPQGLVRANHAFKVLDLYHTSTDSGQLQYKSRRSQETIWAIL